MQIQIFSKSYMRFQAYERRHSFSLSHPVSPFVENLVKSTNLLIHLNTEIERAKSSQRVQHQGLSSMSNIYQRVSRQSTSWRPKVIESTSVKKMKKMSTDKKSIKECAEKLSEIVSRLESHERVRSATENNDLEQGFKSLKPIMRDKIRKQNRENEEAIVEQLVQHRKPRAMVFLRQGNHKNSALRNHGSAQSREEAWKQAPNQEPMMKKQQSRSSKPEGQRFYTFEEKESEESIEALRNQNRELRYHLQKYSNYSRQLEKRFSFVQPNFPDEGEIEEIEHHES